MIFIQINLLNIFIKVNGLQNNYLCKLLSVIRMSDYYGLHAVIIIVVVTLRLKDEPHRTQRKL